MEKNNRDQYFEAWLSFLKGKNQIDPKALAEFLGEKLQGTLPPTTMRRYTATIIANLYENGFLFGKPGKPLEIIQEITLPILEKSLTANYKKIKFIDLEQTVGIVESLPEASKSKKSRKGVDRKKVNITELATETPPKKSARKPAKPKAKKAAKPGPRKVLEAKAEKPTGRKPGPKKKVAEKPTRTVAAKTKKKPGRKPGRPGKKAEALVPVARGRKLTARRADVVKKGQQALEFFLDQQRQIDEMAHIIANYERVFAAVRGLFSREMEEIEDLVAGLLE